MAQPKQPNRPFTTMMTTLSSLLVLLISISISDSYSSTRHVILPPLSIRQMTTTTTITSRYIRNCRPLAMTTTTTNEEDMEFAEGFGVGEKTLGIRDLINNQEDSNVAMPDADLVQPAPPIMQQEQQQEPSSSSKKDDEASVAANTRTLSPKAVLRFIAPTMALWIAPPIMSLIDTSAVGRFCGPTELAGTCTVGSLVYIHHASCIVGSVFTQLNRHDSLFVPLSLSQNCSA
jgi:hypothetical protein